MLISTEKWTTHPNNCRKGQCVIRNAACVIWFLWRRSLLDNMTIIQQPKHIRLQVWPFCSYLNWVFQPPFTFAIETSSKWLTLQPPTWMYTNLPGGWLLCLYLWVDPWKSETWEPPRKEVKSTDFKSCPQGAAGNLLHGASKKNEAKSIPRATARNEWSGWEQM